MGDAQLTQQTIANVGVRYGLFFGGKYTSSRFVTEAIAKGVNRTVDPRLARKLNYGDTIVMSNWNHEHPVAVCEFRVTSVTFNSEIADAACAGLVAQGKCIYEDGGGVGVDRECGGYNVAGTYHLDGSVKLGDLVDEAIKLAKESGVKLNTYIGGPLTTVYDPHAPFIGEMEFTRALFQIKNDLEVDSQTRIPLTQAEADGQDVVAIKGYHRK